MGWGFILQQPLCECTCERKARNRDCLPVVSVPPEIPCTETLQLRGHHLLNVRSEHALCGCCPDILQVWCHQANIHSRWAVQLTALLSYWEAGWLC